MRAAEWRGGWVPVEDRSEARTPLGTRRVSASQGWAGEKGDFFSMLPKNYRPLRVIAKRAMVTHLGQYLFSYLIIKILPPTCPGCKWQR